MRRNSLHTWRRICRAEKPPAPAVDRNQGGAKKATCSLSASRPGIAATVRRAIKTHASCEDISLTPSLHGTYDRPECVAAVGRVFGAGCRQVYFDGNTVALENAFEDFVKTTEGRLQILRVGHGTLRGRRWRRSTTSVTRTIWCLTLMSLLALSLLA